MPEPPKLDLKKVLQEERREKLSPVPPDFYGQAQRLVQELETDLKRAEQGSTKYQMIEDELNAAKKNYSSILETRMAKINYEASTRKSLKRQENTEPENLTPEERELYENLYSTMRDWRSARLQVKVKETEGKPDIKPDIKSDVKSAAQPAPEPKPEPKRDFKDYVVVRVLANIPTFAGMDGRNYTLSAQDVATVPAVNAKALIARKMAVQIPGVQNAKA